MVVTTHQPIFLPWPGFFYKALHADAHLRSVRELYAHAPYLEPHLAALDLALNCGPKARDILAAGA